VRQQDEDVAQIVGGDRWLPVISIEEAEANRESERRDGGSGLHAPRGKRYHRSRDGEEADRTRVHREVDSSPLVLNRQAAET
jgi:hypothetical protein